MSVSDFTSPDCLRGDNPVRRRCYAMLGLGGEPYEAMLRVCGMSDVGITELAAECSMVKSE
ncbi:MAG: hypothetical protein J6K28_01590 [Alistipes sp.]|nr:hypothetical protein [Alistipes sp.]